MSKLVNYTEEILKVLTLMLDRRIQQALILPTPEHIHEHHIVQPAKDFQAWLKKYPDQHDALGSIYPNRNLVWKDTDNANRQINLHTQITEPLEPFGYLLKSADNPDKPTNVVNESTLWPEMKEVVEQCFVWQKQCDLARRLVSHYVRQCRGPYQLAATWEQLYRVLDEHRVFGTKAMTIERAKWGRREDTVKSEWREAKRVISEWIAASRMLPSGGQYSISHVMPKLPDYMPEKVFL